jgi:gamma-glutamyltranspeptidase / glutathione hydrolase / leukotriene-C4 hydrolase
MDDFSIPGTVNAYGLPSSPANYIVPGKRPLSSMTPTIVVDRKGDVQMVIGGAGGSKITTSVAYTIVRHLYLNETIEEAMNAKRIHHQLAPMYIQHEQDFPQALLNDLLRRGHVLQESPPDAGFAALTALARNPDGRLVGVFDHRRGGAEVTFKN